MPNNLLFVQRNLFSGHRARGIEHRAWGMGQRALGIGRGAKGIGEIEGSMQ